MTSVDLVAVGLNATDTLIRLPKFPKRGSKTEYDAESVMPGGQAANTAIACQTWGLKTRYVGKLGDDDASKLHAREFEKAGVDAHLIHVANAASPKSVILVDYDGERTVLCRRDERVILQPEELRREWIEGARALHIDGHDTAAAIQAATWARECGVAVVADLDETYAEVDVLLEKIDYLIASRDFPSRLTGEKNLGKALREIQARYGCRMTSATLGEQGALAWDGSTLHYAPAYDVSVVDTTGAGDLFHASFIYGLLQDWGLDRQLDFSCAAAGMNCTARGARGGIRDVDAIHAFMKTTQHHEEDPELASQIGMLV